jgi:hypothetical protein
VDVLGIEKVVQLRYELEEVHGGMVAQRQAVEIWNSEFGNTSCRPDARSWILNPGWVGE